MAYNQSQGNISHKYAFQPLLFWLSFLTHQAGAVPMYDLCTLASLRSCVIVDAAVGNVLQQQSLERDYLQTLACFEAHN
eukprot:5497050-Pleurochrysis_carterae.AAC.2